MKAMLLKDPFNMVYIDKEKPVPGHAEALLKIRAVGICGTDIHAYTGKQPFFNYPRILGHEICAEVAEVDSACESITIGQRVSVIPCDPCYSCFACREGRTNCCESASLFGVHKDGAFQEYLSVPEKNLVVVPDELSDSTVALIEPFAIGAHAIARVGVKQSDDVLVIGAGPIGIGIAAIAKEYGANVVVADVQASRRKHIETVLKLKTVNPLDEGFSDDLKSSFNNMYPQTVIDVTGNPQSMNNSINFLRHAGKLEFVGLFIGELCIDDVEFHKRETTLFSSRNATRDDFNEVIRLFQKGALSEGLMKNKELDFLNIHNYGEDVINDKALIKAVINFS